MEKLDCIYIDRIEGEKGAINRHLHMIGELKMGTIKQSVKENHKKIQEDIGEIKRLRSRQADKHLIRQIKRLCTKDTVILANQKIIQDFGIANTLFELRKRELLENVSDITKYLRKRLDDAGRKSFLLWLHSEQWSWSEIHNILYEVKKYYEDIYIVNYSSCFDEDRLSYYFYEEYGVALHFLRESQALQLGVDTVFFLVEEWKDVYQQIVYWTGYVVAELEGNIRRERRRFRIEGEPTPMTDSATKNKDLYTGFVYAHQGKELPYELSVAALYHDFLREMLRNTEGENAISIVAIYRLE